MHISSQNIFFQSALWLQCSYFFTCSKGGLLLNNVLGITGACLMGFTKMFHSYEMLFLGRFIIGVNCGKSTTFIIHSISGFCHNPWNLARPPPKLPLPLPFYATHHLYFHTIQWCQRCYRLVPALPTLQVLQSSRPSPPLHGNFNLKCQFLWVKCNWDSEYSFGTQMFQASKFNKVDTNNKRHTKNWFWDSFYSFGTQNWETGHRFDFSGHIFVDWLLSSSSFIFVVRANLWSQKK